MFCIAAAVRRIGSAVAASSVRYQSGVVGVTDDSQPTTQHEQPPCFRRRPSTDRNTRRRRRRPIIAASIERQTQLDGDVTRVCWQSD